jgi:hypothetical protein
MVYTVSKFEGTSASTVSQIHPCNICGQFTDMTARPKTGPLLHFNMWIRSPRGARTEGCVLRVHVACLKALIPEAADGK